MHLASQGTQRHRYMDKFTRKLAGTTHARMCLVEAYTKLPASNMPAAFTQSFPQCSWHGDFSKDEVKIAQDADGFFVFFSVM